MFEFIDDASPSQNMGKGCDVDVEFSAVGDRSVEFNTEICNEEFAKFFCKAGFFFVSFNAVSKGSGGTKISSVSSKKRSSDEESSEINRLAKTFL